MLNSGPGFGFNIMFSIVPIFIAIIFIVVIVTILKQVINRGVQKTKPVQSSGAKVISKRNHVWGEHSRTSYYATFELEDGQRIEYNIPSNKIGYIVEGDIGQLTFQGTLFVDFNRQVDYDYYE